MFLQSRAHALIAFPIIFALSACGGGGDEAPPPVSSPATFPLSVVAEALVKETASYAVRIEGTASQGGQSIPLTGTGTYSVSNSSSTFEGIPSIKRNSATTGTMGANGISIPVADSSADYFGTDFKPLGRVANGTYCVYGNQTSIPVSAKVGDSGTWFTGTCYSSSSKLSKLGSTVVSYVLEADTATTATLKLIQQLTGTSGQTGTATFAYRVTTSGSYTRVFETAGLNERGVLVSLTVTFP